MDHTIKIYPYGSTIPEGNPTHLVIEAPGCNHCSFQNGTEDCRNAPPCGPGLRKDIGAAFVALDVDPHLRVGGVFQYKGTLYEVVENDGCEGCEFNKDVCAAPSPGGGANPPRCGSMHRGDSKSVQFRLYAHQLTKVEPEPKPEPFQRLASAQIDETLEFEHKGRTVWLQPWKPHAVDRRCAAACFFWQDAECTAPRDENDYAPCVHGKRPDGETVSFVEQPAPQAEPKYPTLREFLASATHYSISDDPAPLDVQVLYPVNGLYHHRLLDVDVIELRHGTKTRADIRMGSCGHPGLTSEDHLSVLAWEGTGGPPRAVYIHRLRKA